MSNNNKTLNRDSLSQQLAAILVENIHSGHYKPGTSLPSENVLSNEYNVSRPVVRETLRILDGKGFIKIERGKGAFIQEINDIPLKVFFRRALSDDTKAWTDLTYIRKTLEAKSAALAAQQRTEKEFSRLKELLESMENNIDNYTEYSKIDIQFHIEVAKISKNSFLFYLISSIRDSLFVVVDELRHQLNKEERLIVQKQHLNILNAIEAQDEKKAEQAMNEHFDDIMKRIRKIIDKQKDYVDPDDSTVPSEFD